MRERQCVRVWVSVSIWVKVMTYVVSDNGGREMSSCGCCSSVVSDNGGGGVAAFPLVGG
jgi:hypothetical protein